MRGVNNSVETVNAAAAAIASAESRVQQVTDQRRRWGACFSVYWCFKSQRHSKRIRRAVLVPEPTLPGADAPAPENPTHPPALRLPFIVPPSSPASFFQSEPPSATQSPVGIISLSALSANVYSPPGPNSIFAIGPYANETQLVSPPVFSTFTTEPSSAPFTPPPEPFHLTTPSSPEVPFAQLLTSSLDSSCKKSEAYEFQSYQLYPGSPIAHLISPSSACSGTSSPYPDTEFYSSGVVSFPTFPVDEPPKILTAESLAVHKLIPQHARNGGSLLDGQISAIAPVPDKDIRCQSDELAMDHRVSFELNAEEVRRCMGKKLAISCEATSESSPDPTAATTETNQSANEADNTNGCCVDETYHDLPQNIQPSVAVAVVKEFKFDNSDGDPAEPSVGSEWWANEKVVTEESRSPKNWAFFPMIQPGVS